MNWFPLKRRRLLGLKASKSRQTHLPIQHGDKFDETTGQVYTETNVPIPSSSNLNWARKIHVVREKYEQDHIGYAPHEPSIRSNKGVRSLQEMIMETTINNLDRYTAEYLAMLPTPLLKWLWDEVNRRGLMSLYLWQTLSKLLLDYPEQAELTLKHMRFRLTIESPIPSLDIYTLPLTSISYDFIAVLSITTSFTLPDLVRLSEIPNLGVLEIINKCRLNKSVVRDCLVRAWNIAALGGAFKVLRILRLWNHLDVTSESLSYLTNFPILGVYDVRGCGLNSTSPTYARALGWKPTVDLNIHNILQAACVERAMLLRAQLGLDPQPVRRGLAEQIWDGARVWKLLRTDVAAFLTRDESSRPGTPRAEVTFNTMNDIADQLQRDNPLHAGDQLRTNRWQQIDDCLFKKSRMAMTWDFQLSSAYARLGELRDDRDLERAGIDISDQVMVGDELVNSVPMVSIRLGPTTAELRPESPHMSTHAPLYTSILPCNFSSPLPQMKRSPDYNPKAMAFFRVEAPFRAEKPVPEKTKTRQTEPAQESKSKVSTAENKENETCRVEHVQKRKSGVGIAKNKKLKLSEVLSAFL